MIKKRLTNNTNKVTLKFFYFLPFHTLFCFPFLLKAEECKEVCKGFARHIVILKLDDDKAYRTAISDGYRLIELLRLVVD